MGTNPRMQRTKVTIFSSQDILAEGSKPLFQCYLVYEIRLFFFFFPKSSVLSCPVITPYYLAVLLIKILEVYRNEGLLDK